MQSQRFAPHFVDLVYHAAWKSFWRKKELKKFQELLEDKRKAVLERARQMLSVENILGAHHDVWAVNTDFEYHEEQRLDAAGQDARSVWRPEAGE
jgi:hypothetical protein